MSSTWKAYELTLAEGLRFERRTFHSLFATNDQKEGESFDYTSEFIERQ
jgi:hypothetical protein